MDDLHFLRAVWMTKNIKSYLILVFGGRGGLPMYYTVLQRGEREFETFQKLLCNTRNLGRSAPLFLAPSVGWEPFGLPAGGPSGPQQYSISMFYYFSLKAIFRHCSSNGLVSVAVYMNVMDGQKNAVFRLFLPFFGGLTPT